MPVPEFMKTAKVGRVAHITIDHPPLNTINTEILKQLARDVLKYEADDSVRVILLDSANQKPPFAARWCCASRQPWLASAVRNVARGPARAHRDRILFKASRHAIYDGVCMDGGLELALSCHIRVAGSGTLFAVPEAPAGVMRDGQHAKSRPLFRPRQGARAGFDGMPDYCKRGPRVGSCESRCR